MTFPMIALLQAGYYAEPHAARYDAATMGMFVLIIAILCGLGSFGPMGLIIGPVLLAIAMQAVEEAHQTYHHMA